MLNFKNFLKHNIITESYSNDILNSLSNASITALTDYYINGSTRDVSLLATIKNNYDIDKMNFLTYTKWADALEKLSDEDYIDNYRGVVVVFDEDVFFVANYNRQTKNFHSFFYHNGSDMPQVYENKIREIMGKDKTSGITSLSKYAKMFYVFSVVKNKGNGDIYA